MIRRQKDFPKELWIGENVWSVVFVRRIPEEPISTLGLCDASEYKIYIRMGQTKEERFKTLLHEVFHALEHEFRLEIPHILVHKLEEPIIRLLMDNGLIF